MCLKFIGVKEIIHLRIVDSNWDIENKDHLSPTETEIGAELGNNLLNVNSFKQ